VRLAERGDHQLTSRAAVADHVQVPARAGVQEDRGARGDAREWDAGRRARRTGSPAGCFGFCVRAEVDSVG